MTSARMMTQLRDAGVAFGADDEMPLGFWLNMNDVFDYATADAELVEERDIPAVYALWQEHGIEGVIWWVSQKRGVPPISKVTR